MSSANVSTSWNKRIRGLQEDLTKLINNPESSDVVFVCQDGVDVHACRLLLTARSSFFTKMLQNGVAESGKSTVALPTVESSVFLVVLKYLYTAELPEEGIYHSSGGANRKNFKKSRSRTRFYQLDWKVIIKVVIAARFLMLECLQRHTLERLRADVPAKCAGGVCQTCTKAVQAGGFCYTCATTMQTLIVMNLSTLCEHSELWWGVGEAMIKSIDETGSALVDILESILASEDLRFDTLIFMCKGALIYYLAKTRKTAHDHEKADEVPEWSLDEYFKLRKILFWCAIRSPSISDISSFDPVCLPGPKRVIQYLEASEKPHQIFSSVDANTLSLDREVLVNAIDKEDLKPFLQMVELSSIHPELLYSVIKPLDIINLELLSNTFGEQAVIGTWWIKKRKISHT